MGNLKILEWAYQNQVKTNKGSDIEFEDHAFLLEYLEDPSRRIVVKKCTQAGISYSTLLKVLYLVEGRPSTVLYTLPSGSEARDFVLSKVDPLIERSAGLRAKIVKVPFRDKPLFSVAVKRIGDSYFFFKGAWAEHKAQSIDCDILVVDELDFQAEDVKEMFEERISGAGSMDTIFWIGTPTIPNYGITQLYESSSQKEWHITCPKCKVKQVLSWPESIDEKRRVYVCKNCRSELDNNVRKSGIWIPKYPDREIVGYSFNKLMAPWVKASKILDDFKTKRAKNFWNFTLGQPYEDTTVTLSRQSFFEAVVDPASIPLSTGVVMGIDQGDEFHVIVGHAGLPNSLVTYGFICQSQTELEDKINAFKPSLIIMDMLPNKHTAKQLQDKYGSDKFILANPRDWQLTAFRSYIDLDRAKGLLSMERTESLDVVIDRIQKKQLLFSKHLFNLETIYLHISNCVSDFQIRFGRQRKVWRSVGKDHFLFAINFFLAGCEMLYPMAKKIEAEAFVYYDEIDQRKLEEWDFQRSLDNFGGGVDSIIIPPKEV